MHDKFLEILVSQYLNQLGFVFKQKWSCREITLKSLSSRGGNIFSICMINLGMSSVGLAKNCVPIILEFFLTAGNANVYRRIYYIHYFRLLLIRRNSAIRIGISSWIMLHKVSLSIPKQPLINRLCVEITCRQGIEP